MQGSKMLRAYKKVKFYKSFLSPSEFDHRRNIICNRCMHVIYAPDPMYDIPDPSFVIYDEERITFYCEHCMKRISKLKK